VVPPSPRRRRAPLVVLALLVVGIALAVVRAQDTGGGVEVVDAPVGLLRTAIGTYAEVDAETAGRYDYVVLQSWREDALAALRDAGDGTKVLAYKNLSFVTCPGTPDHVPGGVPCEEARERDWILRDTGGAEITSQHYAGLHLADVGNPDYQSRWLELAREEAETEGWDGIAIDDVNPDIGWHVGPNLPPAYPNDQAWRRATGEMVAVVGRGLREAGLVAIGNVCCLDQPEADDGAWGEWAERLSGAMKEHFVKAGGPEDYIDEPRWLGHVELARDTQRRGRLFVAGTSADPADERAATFGLATALLATEGRMLFTLLNADNSVEPWLPVYERARALGDPAGGATESDGVHSRDFEHGVVLVNPGDEERRADEVVLPPRTAAIVLRD
jgi:hypothetical protein